MILIGFGLRINFASRVGFQKSKKTFMQKFIVYTFFTLIIFTTTMSQSTVKILRSPKKTVELFLNDVRSGLHPEKAIDYMGDTIIAHQLTSENPTTIKRTPENYTEHIREFLSLFGKFEFTVTELLADGNKVYARWIQKGNHLADLDNFIATGMSLIEYTSAVYRVEQGKIVEYWLQSDRLGFDEQLKRNALKSTGQSGIKE